MDKKIQINDVDEKKPLNIRLAIEDAIWPYVALNVGVGDLFFVDNDVYFICYCQGVAQSNGLGYLMGGLVGGLSNNSLDKARLDGAKQAAAKTRQNYYAISLKERVEQLPHSLAINNIKSVTYEEKTSVITCIASTGEKTTIIVPKLSDKDRALVAEFPNGVDSLYPKEDPYGLLIDALSPKALTECLEKEQVDAATLEKIASNDQYLFSLFEQIFLMKPEQQKALSQNLRGAPTLFSKALAKEISVSLDKEAKTQKNTISIGIILGVIFIGISLIFDLANKNFICGGAFGLFGLVCLIIIPLQAKSHKRKKEFVAQEVLKALGKF